MLTAKQVVIVESLANDPAEIRAKLAEAQEMLEALESGKMHIGRPFEGRTEAKMFDLRREIVEYQSILDKNNP